MQIGKHYNEFTWIKAIATVFITWFHFKWFVPQQLAPLFVGGAIGNSLFFFCSGYLLKFKEEKYLGQWILKKYLRIMPVVWLTFTICTASHFITDCRWKPTSIGMWFVPGYYWFVCSILLYYFISWTCKSYLSNEHRERNILLLISITCIIQLFWYFLFCDTAKVNIDEGYVKAWYFYAFFLWGYYCKQKNINFRCQKWKVLFAPLSLVFFFGYKYLAVKYDSLAYWQVLFIPLFLSFVIISFLCIAKRFASANIPLWLKQFVVFVSNITLEIYIVQIHVIEYVMPRVLFPYNILVSICFILLFAYLVHKSVEYISRWLKWI